MPVVDERIFAAMMNEREKSEPANSSQDGQERGRATSTGVDELRANKGGTNETFTHLSRLLMQDNVPFDNLLQQLLGDRYAVPLSPDLPSHKVPVPPDNETPFAGICAERVEGAVLQTIR